MNELSEKLNDILLKIKEEDNSAMGEFYLLFSKRLLVIANTYFSRKVDVEDAASSFYYDKLIHSVKKYKNGKNPTAWLLKVFKRYLLDIINKSKVESDHKEKYCSVAQTCVDEGLYLENYLFFGELKPYLTPFEWRLMESHMLMGMPIREIAASFHMPKSTVEYKIQKLREKFKKILDEYNS